MTVSLKHKLLDYLQIVNNHIHILACDLFPSDLVEFVLQHAGVQAQLTKAILLHSLNDAVHLCVVLSGQVGEVDVRRDELSAEHTCVKEAQDLLCISAWKIGETQKRRMCQ